MNAGSAPERVGKVHLTDQPPNFRRYARPAGMPTRFPPPEGAKASSVPADDGLRLNNPKRIQNARCNREDDRSYPERQLAREHERQGQGGRPYHEELGEWQGSDPA